MPQSSLIFHDLAFYGSAIVIAIFLAFVAIRATEGMLNENLLWRFSIRSLFAAMTLIAIVLGIFSLALKR